LNRLAVVVKIFFLLGTFAFSISNICAELPNADNIHIGYGDNITNSIILPGCIDVYTFDAEAGDIINIQVKGEESTFDPRIELYSPIGTLITEDVEFNGLLKIDTLRLADSGIYSIFVMDEGEDDTSSYGLSLQRVFDPGNGEYVECNNMTSATIRKLAEMDAFILNGTAGDIFVMQVIGIDANFDPRVEIYNPEGVLISSKEISDWMLKIYMFVLPASGS
jgi:hypothetical protein